LSISFMYTTNIIRFFFCFEHTFLDHFQNSEMIKMHTRKYYIYEKAIENLPN